MYKLPETLSEDITQFATLAKGYQRQEVDPVQFKAFRVPMGIYEQRQDGVYMSRIRTTGGVIYPAQLLSVINIAQKYRSNLLHITTRQEIQIQNLQLDDLEPILIELQKEGLSTKGGGGNTIRNILVSEESGFSVGEIFDTTPYAMALTTKLIAESDSYLLPRKMKIAFSSDDRKIGYAAVNDVGFVAKIKDGKKGFFVYAGGGAGAKPTIGWKLFDFIPESELFAVAEALKKFFSEHGNRKNRNKARLRFIFYKLGEEETIRLIGKYYEEAKTKHSFQLAEAVDERPQHTYPKHTGTQETDSYLQWKKRYVTFQRQDNYSSVLLPIPLGNIRLDDERQTAGLRKLLLFVSRFGNHTVRFTTTQNIRLRNIPNAALVELYDIISEFNAESQLPAAISNIVSCTGADTCRLGIGLSKGLATAIRKELLKSKTSLDDFSAAKIHISGCPNSCGQHLWGDVGFSGKALRNERAYPGYHVYLAASRDDNPQLAEPVGSISAREVPRFVRRLLEAYPETKGKYASFSDYLRLEGKDLALQLIDEYREIPSFSEDKNYYFDWGSETPFSVVSRGVAECSAGLFDMIELDRSIIRSHRQELETATDKADINRLLYLILYSASRMLLVTRGLEPKTTEDAFNLFIANFIEYGLVEKGYKDIVSVARDEKTYDFSARKDEIYALADRVIALYESMDDSLQFKTAANPEPRPERPKEKQGTVRRKDLRGFVCPMNFVQTKLQLAAMQSGETLEIWLDDGHPINNVPASIRNEGHTILEQTQIDNYWRVLIKKK
ncbi:MAG: sulfurtransferase TusA family protein [Dysgonamonadaceae bacterium]|jgi:sulfite reductase (ferredoxin)|nr:sulfurtransferase TusA family protein [Dysgonamonadaceae bacterium]